MPTTGARSVASDLVLVDKDRNFLEGGDAVEDTAYFIHSRLHLANPKARCVLHTHMIVRNRTLPVGRGAA